MYALYGLEPGIFGGAYESWLKGVHLDAREIPDDLVNRALRGVGVNEHGIPRRLAGRRRLL